jgi:hypothetical protein
LDGIYPEHLLGFLPGFEVEVDNHRLLAASRECAFEAFARRRVDLVVRHIRRDKDEIAGAGLGDVFEMLASAHPRPTFHDTDDALEVTVGDAPRRRAKLMAAARFMPGV